MSRKILALAVAAVLSLNACNNSNDSKDEVDRPKVRLFNETNVSLLNEYFLIDVWDESRKMHHNCPLLPADPILYPAPECHVIDSEGNKECRGVPTPVFPTDPEALSKELEDPEKAYYYELLKSRQEELQRVRSDSTRTAILTISNGRTIIKAAPFFYDAFFEIELKDSKKADTLYIELISIDPSTMSPVDFDNIYITECPLPNGQYVEGEKIDPPVNCVKQKIESFWSGSDCPISFDIALNYVDKDIAVIVFENSFGAQVFQAKYQ